MLDGLSISDTVQLSINYLNLGNFIYLMGLKDSKFNVFARILDEQQYISKYELYIRLGAVSAFKTSLPMAIRPPWPAPASDERKPYRRGSPCNGLRKTGPRQSCPKRHM